MTTGWRTIDVLRIDEVAHAYQQKVRVGKKKVGNPAKGGYAYTVPKEEHRLVPITETISDENLIDRLG